MNATAAIFGNYIEPQEYEESLSLHFSSSYLSLQHRWLNNSRTANFLAEYWNTFFLSYEATAGPLPTSIKETVGYIANELLDNAIKYGSPSTDQTTQVNILITLSPAYLRFYVTNCGDPESWGTFQDYIKMLLTEDPEFLYFRQMEQNAASQKNSVSRLGLLSIIHDYHGQVAWKFAPPSLDSGEHTVTTMVQIPVNLQ